MTLKELRKLHGLTQIGLAMRLAGQGKGSGYQRTVASLESGKAVALKSLKLYLFSLGYDLVIKAVERVDDKGLAEAREFELDISSLDGSKK